MKRMMQNNNSDFKNKEKLEIDDPKDTIEVNSK